MLESNRDLYKKTRVLARKTNARSACEATGMSLGTYYSIRAKMAAKHGTKAPVRPGKAVKRSSKPTITRIAVPEVMSSRLIVLIGNPHDVMSAVRSYQ